ncbi:uncharacterized protein BDV14DRAFT_41189 [Aspergillus stella-maris]|uniref:uncharacterized protein n=1 Tax=Aspergillus stella-maris TaxID=1810926 RepID=UPI003CCCFE9F
MSDRHRGRRADEEDRHRQKSERRRRGGTPVPRRASSLSRLGRKEENIHRTRRDDTSQTIIRRQPKPEKTDISSGQRRIQPRDNAPSLAIPMTTKVTRRGETATRAERGDNGSADIAGDSELDGTRGRGPARDRSSTRRDQSDDNAARRGYRRRSSSGRRDCNRSVSLTRQLREKAKESVGLKERSRSMDKDRRVISLAKCEEDSIVYGKKGAMKVQAEATAIERGTYGGENQKALYLRVRIKMFKLRNIKEVDATLEFRRQDDKSGYRVPILRSSPEKLYGIRQSVNENYGTNTHFGAQAGTEATNVNTHRENSRAMDYTLDHLPKLEVTGMDHTLSINLFKTGQVCSFEKEFSVQMVIPYKYGERIYVGCDIKAGPLVVRGCWREIMIAEADISNEDYYYWTGEDFQRRGNCELFYENVSEW